MVINANTEWETKDIVPARHNISNYLCTSTGVNIKININMHKLQDTELLTGAELRGTVQRTETLQVEIYGPRRAFKC